MTPSVAARAPAEVSPGERGWRGILAGLASAAALVALLSSQSITSGSLEQGGTFIHYRLDGPSWTATALYLAAAGLFASALLLWIAKRAGAFLVGLALLPLAVAAGVSAHTARDGAGGISSAEGREVGPPASRASVERRLGPPAGHAEARRGRTGFDCLIYQVEDADRTRAGTNAAYCFAGDRLAFRELSP